MVEEIKRKGSDFDSWNKTNLTKIPLKFVHHVQQGNSYFRVFPAVFYAFCALFTRRGSIFLQTQNLKCGIIEVQNILSI